MPNYNRTTRVKRGETGHVITVTLYDDNDDPLDLSAGGSWTVTIKVTASGSTTNLLAGSSMTNANQVTYPGRCSYTMTSNDALIAAGEYDIEITATSPAGRVSRFPKDDGTAFGTLIMMASKV